MVTHVAGPGLKLGKLAIQRCMICGEAIIKDDLSHVMVPEGETFRPAFFDCGAFVEIESSSGCTRASINGQLPEHFDMDLFPETSCVNLVEI